MNKVRFQDYEKPREIIWAAPEFARQKLRHREGQAKFFFIQGKKIFSNFFQFSAEQKNRPLKKIENIFFSFKEK